MISYRTFIQVEQILSEYTQSIGTDFLTDFGPFFVAFCTLYVMIIGLMIAKGKGDAQELITSLILLAVLNGFLISGGYNKYFVEPITETTKDLSAYFISKSPTADAFDLDPDKDFESAFLVMDKLYVRMAVLADTLCPEIELLNLKVDQVFQFILCIIMFCAYVFLHLVYAAVILMSFVCMHILLAIGAPFIFFAAFKKSRALTFTWIKAVSSYAATMVMASIVISITLYSINAAIVPLEKITDEVSYPVFLQAFLQVLLSIALGAVMCLKAPDMGAGLTNTMPGSTAGIAAGVGAVGAGSIGVGKIAAGAMSGGALSAGMWASGKLAGRGVWGANATYNGLSKLRQRATK
ncbi:type IV secretion system protein [Desulfovibrio ferrophilus]|uniref:TrbL/VirB6 plasmid conjugal transfer protein n=1 Tax=Desulfovibrio ferrophilus TaxID=241368 RepID=A0A2Z6B467_9BACT|nr:type IV secretion system protein [Desulfovibrio ferrophilus]BBD10155.1 uncharacterized protein DFE_A0054 [Desulfovibrio ferrophilus]